VNPAGNSVEKIAVAGRIVGNGESITDPVGQNADQTGAPIVGVARAGVPIAAKLDAPAAHDRLMVLRKTSNWNG
jgi:hypothetical protein